LNAKINKEIRNYSESIFFGLSMRQFVFSLLAVLVAVGLYYLLSPYFGLETLSWMVILAAAPFAVMGFVSYHGMSAEQFLITWIRSELIEPRQLSVQVNNLYYEAMKKWIAAKEKGGKRKRVKNT
jgi:hypothetical protein